MITSITSDSSDKALSALYNPDLEIEQVQHTLPQTFDESYSYDTRGNRLTSLTNNYTYNDLNQLTNTTTNTYTYDANGNMIEEKNLATTETKKFYYNSENRMIKFEHYPTDLEPADIIAEYKYDIYGRRLQKNVNGTITNFFWEGDNMSFELNENNQPIRRYIYENGKDDVMAHVEYSEVSDPEYLSYEHKGCYSYIKDQVGTITKVYKHETKQMINTRTYDTFGNLINQTGSSSGNLGFQSKYYDQESGLHYYYHRYYYPSIGRFINEDPIGFKGGPNLLKSFDNNPINFIDPYGQKYKFPWGPYIIRRKILYEETKFIQNLFDAFNRQLTECEKCLIWCMGNIVFQDILKKLITDLWMPTPTGKIKLIKRSVEILVNYIISNYSWKECKKWCKKRGLCCD